MPSVTNVSRRLSTASMPACAHSKPALCAGRIIVEVLPGSLVIPPRFHRSADCRSAGALGASTTIPTIVPSSPQSAAPPQRPVLCVPSNTTSPPTSLRFPRVVVVNPISHLTPPANPQALCPATGVPAFVQMSTHLLPLPAWRPLHTRQIPEASVTSSDAQRQAPVFSAAGPAASAAATSQSQQPPSKLSGEILPPPSPSSPASSELADETLKPSDRCFFLQLSGSPDVRSPDTESPLASTSKFSDTQSPSSEASSQMKTNVGHAVSRRATAPGKARARKSRETVRHAPTWTMTTRGQSRPPAAQKKTSAEPKKVAFNNGSTSSNGSRDTGTTGHSGQDGRQSRENCCVRPATPLRNSRNNGQAPRAPTNTKTNGKGNTGPANRKGTVVSTDLDFEMTESDDDSEWVSEDTPDERELARQREETRLGEAAEEVKRQRDMFAKVSKQSYTDLSSTRSGLLSQLLNPDPSVLFPRHPLPTSFSSQDMTQLRRSGRDGAPCLPTSKSTVAMSQAAQVTAQVPSMTTSGYRPKGGPQGENVEYDSDSGDETGDNGIQVPHSLAQQKLAALADPNRRRYSDRGLPSAQEPVRPVLPTVATAPIALRYPYNLPTPAPPMTPRTTRRQMLATELSESLRQNLLWERQVSKINMTGGARRGGLLGSGLRPLTAITQEVPTS